MSTTKTGRPTKLTPHLQEEICKFIAAGNYISTACQAVGINPETLRRWSVWALQEQENGGGMYYDFYVAIKKAEAEAEAALASMIKETALDKKEWLPAMTFLERRHPDRWGRRDRQDVNISETKSITITRIEVIMPGEIAPQLSQGEVIDGEVKELPLPETL